MVSVSVWWFVCVEYVFGVRVSVCGLCVLSMCLCVCLYVCV